MGVQNSIIDESRFLCTVKPLKCPFFILLKLRLFDKTLKSFGFFELTKADYHKAVLMEQNEDRISYAAWLLLTSFMYELVMMVKFIM